MTNIVGIKGGFHVLEIPASTIQKIKDEKFEAIFSECVKSIDNIITSKNILASPLTTFSLFLYFGVLKIFGTDKKSLEKISESKNIELVDASIDDLYNHLNVLENYIVELSIVLSTFWYNSEFLKGQIIEGIVIPFIIIVLCVFLFAVRTFWMRNKIMVENTVRIARQKGFSKIFFYCGAQHVSDIKKLFEKEGYEVKIFK